MTITILESSLKSLNKKKNKKKACLRPFNQKASLFAGLGAKQQSFQ